MENAALALLLAVGPALADDLKTLTVRLGKIGNQLKDPHRIVAEPDNHMENLRALRIYRALVDEVKRTYGDRMNKAEFDELRAKWHYAQHELSEYERYARMFASSAAIEARLQAVKRSAELGVKNQAPAFFAVGNDIDRGLKTAGAMCKALEAMEPDSQDLARCKSAIEETSKSVAEMARTMRADVVKANAPPADEYRGPDRDALVKIVRKKWDKDGNGAEVLKVGVASNAWTRKWSIEKIGGAWTESDYSRIQGFVLVKGDGEVAVRHSINIQKNHLQDDAISTSFLNDPKAEPSLCDVVLLSKLR